MATWRLSVSIPSTKSERKTDSGKSRRETKLQNMSSQNVQEADDDDVVCGFCVGPTPTQSQSNHEVVCGFCVGPTPTQSQSNHEVVCGFCVGTTPVQSQSASYTAVVNSCAQSKSQGKDCHVV